MHYPISSEDAEDWACAIKDELAGLDSPPPPVWVRLLNRKSFDVMLKKWRGRGGGSMGYSNAAEDRGNSGPVINYYIGGKHQSGRRHYYESSAESSPESSGRRDRRTAPTTIRSSPPVHEDVNLHSFKNWYIGKYTRVEDYVSDIVWDQLEAENLTIVMIKGLPMMEWSGMGVPKGTGANISRRAALFESKVTSGELNIRDS